MSARVVCEPYETRADGVPRAAAGRSIYRHVNEHIRQLWRSYDTREPVQLFCECATSGCTETLLAAAERFDDVRARQGVFLVAPGHLEASDIVLGRTREYWVVEDQR